MSASSIPARSNGTPLRTARLAPSADIDQVGEQFAHVCESAVDPLEISSALEFEGLNDQAAMQRYGVPDVFALAEELYRRVPRRPAEPAPPPDLWPASTIRSALHGLLYGLPTVCFPAATGLLAGPHVVSVLTVALLASWATSQALAYLGYVRLGRGGSAQAAQLLLAGMTAGFAGVALAMTGAGLATHAPLPELLFGLGLGAYMLGATVLMVLGADRQLLIVLAPGVLGSTVFLILGRPAYLEHWAWAALAATPLLALGLAAVRVGRAGGLRWVRRGSTDAQPGPVADRLFVASDLLAALPSAMFGLLAAGLLALPVDAGLPGHHGANTGALLASLPLALSMGPAEWALIWFRRRTQRLLRDTQSMPDFSARARLALCAALLQYLLAVVVLTAAVVAVAVATRYLHPHWAVLVPEICAYLTLGCALFLALLLQAFGIRIVPLLACAEALALEFLWRDLGVLGQIVPLAALLIVLATYAALKLGKVVPHAL
jgi:hypothetical protein